MSDAGQPAEQDSPGVIKFQFRIPKSLYDRVKAVAAGGGDRPPAKINPTMVFLLERGLQTIQGATESGATDQ